MKDFPVEIKLQGLRPNAGEPGAEVLIGLRTLKDGYEGLLAPRLTVALSTNWPFPQMLRIGEYTIVATPDALYQVDGTVILSGIDNAGYPWSGSVVGDFIILTNNKVVVSGRAYALTVDTSGLTPAGRCVCECGGQFIIGAPWIYGEHHPKSVAWGGIGHADFTIEEDNLAGIRFAEVGNILAMMPQTFTTLSGLQRGFLVFGSAGVASFVGEDHPVVYKQKVLSEVGVHSQLAVSGVESKAFYLGTDRKVYVVADRKVQALGFDSYFWGAGSEVVFAYDHTQDELWVGL
jgi:hypothetical protein